MKNAKPFLLIILTFVAFLSVVTNSFAQKNAIKVHPLSGKIAYERLFTPNVSGQIAVKVLPISIPINDGDGKIGIKDYSISPEVRFYLGKDREEKLAGFYIAPYLKGGLTEVQANVRSDSDLTEKAKFTGSTIGGGATIGWQWTLNSGFNIGTALGFGLSRFSFNDVEVEYADGNVEREELSGINLGGAWPQFRFSIGYAF